MAVIWQKFLVIFILCIYLQSILVAYINTHYYFYTTISLYDIVIHKNQKHFIHCDSIKYKYKVSLSISFQTRSIFLLLLWRHTNVE